MIEHLNQNYFIFELRQHAFEILKMSIPKNAKR